MRTVVFQHSEIGGPGRLGLTLRDHAHKLDIRRPDKGDPIPPDLDDVDGVISLGGPQNVDEPGSNASWMDRELAFLRAAHDRSLPVIGICLGAQMIAHALGGEVAKMERPEFGFHDVELTPAGQTDAILSGVAWTCPQFQTHGREVARLPPDATLLATNARCKAQAFRVGLRTYGFQYHFESDRDGIAAFAREGKQEFYDAGLAFDEVMKQADAKYDRFGRMADRLCVNLAAYLYPMELHR